MKHFSGLVIATIATVLGLIEGAIHPVQAIPGQSVRDATAWINGHPTLRPEAEETLRVRKQDTAAQRFEFEASLGAPGQFAYGGRIRSESIELFDVPNGVSFERLEESLRVIYGSEIYQDYAGAAIVYDYPQPEDPLPPRPTYPLPELAPEPTFLEIAQRGEVRLGDRFAYWLEITENPDGTAYNGQIVVFLPEDVEKLTQRLEN